MGNERLGTFPPRFFPLPLRALSDSRRSENAVVDRFGTHTYGDLLLKSAALSELLSHSIDDAGGAIGDQVAILVPNDHRY